MRPGETIVRLVRLPAKVYVAKSHDKPNQQNSFQKVIVEKYYPKGCTGLVVAIFPGSNSQETEVRVRWPRPCPKTGLTVYNRYPISCLEVVGAISLGHKLQTTYG